ncbi:MAG TPA: phosphonate ABC transporter ATP-binding protein [Blastocatellia bacterium]|nr:phosphonate ABC transporter ATP-binding protein [Blastocatellia bacterium]
MIYSLNEVTKSYQTRSGPVDAVAGLSFNVRRGERLALVGPSGAGKTTLFRLLNATLRSSSGSLLFEGREVARLSGRELRAMRRRIGTIYQQHYLVPSLSALDNTLCGRLGSWSLLHTIRAAIRPSRQEVEQATATLESVGLADKRFARADELSGGQQQRLAIARVLMQDPDVILADEPFASLDPALTESIGSMLLNIAETGGRTLVVTLHDVEMALRYFPRLVALQGGRLAFDAPSAEVGPGALEALYSIGPSSDGKDSRESEHPSDTDCSDRKFQRNCAR